MALIKCTECGHMVSDKASTCPNCGCPIQPAENTSVNNNNVEPIPEKKENGNWKKWTLIALLLCVIAGGGYFAKTLSNGSGKNAIVKFTPEFIKAIETYDKLGPFNEGYATVKKGEKWGYINTKGEEVIPCQYSEAYSFNDGLAAVSNDGKCGYINTKGQEVIPTQIDAYSAGRFSEGLAFILVDYENFNVIDKTGKVFFSGKCNYFGLTGSGVSEGLEYFLPEYKNGELYVMDSDYNYDVYDNKGKIIKKEKTDPFSTTEGNENIQYEVFQTELKLGEGENDIVYLNGLKDNKGNVLIAPEYDQITYDGLAKISNGVIPVVLEEFGDEVRRGKADQIDTWDGKLHYGYADLKGHDTFSDDIKKKCRESKERAAKKLLKIENEGPDWLQGAWRIGLTDNYGRHMGYMYEVFDHGKSKFYIEDSFMSERDYLVELGNLYSTVNYDKGGQYQLDNENQVLISANGERMQKVSNDTSYKPSSSSYSSSYSSQSSNSYGSSGSSSNNRSFRFSTAYDVMGYLASKTFRNLDGSGSLQIRENGVFVNGRCMTGAPRVTSYSSYSAVVSANIIPQGKITFYVDSEDGTIRDSFGDRYR